MPAEYVSDIGALAMDLRYFSDEEVALAMDFLWDVNPLMFAWLTERLELAKIRATVRSVRDASNRPLAPPQTVDAPVSTEDDTRRG